jgi:putative membrane protein
MGMRAKSFNPQAFLEFLCCAGFSSLMFFFVSSGAYLNYVTPRMKAYLCFTAVVMSVWAAAGLFRIFRPQNRGRCAHCFVLAIPLLLLLLPHTPLGTSDLSYGYTGGSALAGLSTPAAGDSSNAFDGVGTVPAETTFSGAQYTPADSLTTALAGLDAAAKTITVSNDDFYPWLEEIYLHLDQYEGYQISMTGFVYKDPEVFEADEFVLARLGMTCCVADLVPCGMINRYDHTAQLQADSWITVNGSITKGTYDGWDEPQIVVTDISPAEEVEGYLYLYT